jgi:hypothetical protein
VSRDRIIATKAREAAATGFITGIEDACADDGADAEHHQLGGSESALE